MNGNRETTNTACTWKGCSHVGPCAVQRGGHGQVWATLCPTHEAELDEAIEKATPPAMLRAWVLAKGGAAKAAEVA